MSNPIEMAAKGHKAGWHQRAIKPNLEQLNAV